MTAAAQKALARIRLAWDHTHGGRARIGALCAEIEAALAAEKEEAKMATIDDPKALHEYLVRMAMEAYDGGPRYGSKIEVDGDRDAFEERVRERMAQAAQAWVCDRSLADERLARLTQAEAAVAKHEADLNAPITPEEMALARAYTERRDRKKHAEILARAERAEAALCALVDAAADYVAIDDEAEDNARTGPPIPTLSGSPRAVLDAAIHAARLCVVRAEFEDMAEAAGPTPPGPLAVPMVIGDSSKIMQASAEMALGQTHEDES